MTERFIAKILGGQYTDGLKRMDFQSEASSYYVTIATWQKHAMVNAHIGERNDNCH
jgi:hypothetical protein